MFARFLPLVFVAFLAVPAQAQKPVTDSNASDSNSEVFRVVDNPPQLIGGLDGLVQEIQYPTLAKNAGIEGTVIVQFIVDKRGDVQDAKVVRGSEDGGLNEEALRVVRQARFEPGTHDGQRVKVQFVLPISFRLNADR